MTEAPAKPRVLVAADLPDDLRARLAAEFSLIDHILEGRGRLDLSTLPKDVEVMVTRAVFGVSPDLLDALPGLKLVVSMGAGLENIDVEDLKARSVGLAHTPDELTEDVADFAIGLAYALQRRIVEGDRFVRAGRWPSGRLGVAHRVSNRRAGVVGMGRIGRRIAEKAAALGMSVRYCSRTPRRDLSYPYHAELVELARESDLLFVACAGTAETANLIDARVLAALGPEGRLINISRGSVVDEGALIAALQDGSLAGAALDVFANEPNPDPRLLAFDNVVLSPHAASFTVEAREAMIDRLVGAARSYFGERPPALAGAS